jgi:hypothetical protein
LLIVHGNDASYLILHHVSGRQDIQLLIPAPAENLQMQVDVNTLIPAPQPMPPMEAIAGLSQDKLRSHIWLTPSASDVSSVPQDDIPKLDPLDLYCGDTRPSYYTPKLRALPPMK